MALMKDMGSNIVWPIIMAGLPYSVSGCTVDRFCSSGLQTIAFAVASINMGWADLIKHVHRDTPGVGSHLGMGRVIETRLKAKG